MKITTDQPTTGTHLILSDMPNRVYITNGKKKIWVSTSYGEIRVGVDGGKIYKLENGHLREESGED